MASVPSPVQPLAAGVSVRECRLDRRIDVAPFRVHLAGVCQVHKPRNKGFAE
jgi:hypothetical protein